MGLIPLTYLFGKVKFSFKNMPILTRLTLLGMDGADLFEVEQDPRCLLAFSSLPADRYWTGQSLLAFRCCCLIITGG